jgi:predicted Zn-dependent peptidase
MPPIQERARHRSAAAQADERRHDHARFLGVRAGTRAAGRGHLGKREPDASFQLDAVTPNLAASLGLLADYIQHPALDAGELERVRAATHGDQRRDEGPHVAGVQVLYPTLYGPQHPMAFRHRRHDPAVVARLSRDDLATFHKRWFRPDTASVFVVGDTAGRSHQAAGKSFGAWKAPNPPRSRTCQCRFPSRSRASS